MSLFGLTNGNNDSAMSHFFSHLFSSFSFLLIFSFPLSPTQHVKNEREEKRELVCILYLLYTRNYAPFTFVILFTPLKQPNEIVYISSYYHWNKYDTERLCHSSVPHSSWLVQWGFVSQTVILQSLNKIFITVSHFTHFIYHAISHSVSNI